MNHCIFCPNEKFAHIADGLYACADCEKIGFHLVKNKETKECYWKLKTHAIVDEELEKQE